MKKGCDAGPIGKTEVQFRMYRGIGLFLFGAYFVIRPENRLKYKKVLRLNGKKLPFKRKECS